MKEEA